MDLALRNSRFVAKYISWSRNHEFTRFIVVGGVNTLLTYFVYAGLLFFWEYPTAYTVSYISGILISYYLNARFVFREKLRLTKALQYPLVYLVQYLLGLGLLYLFVEIARLSKFVAPILIVLLTVPCTYILSRYVIKGGTRTNNATALDERRDRSYRKHRSD
jgi:putative flippase GtrA